MTIDLMISTSPRNALYKQISDILTLSGNLRDGSSFLNPNVLVDVTNITDFLKYNMVYIPDFNRYYFISDTIAVRSNIIELRLTVDVLTTYAEQIGNSYIIISNNQNSPNSDYLASPDFVANVKHFTDIITFPNGFNDNGDYILITAGGV